jgi:hypothetical protein
MRLAAHRDLSEFAGTPGLSATAGSRRRSAETDVGRPDCGGVSSELRDRLVTVTVQDSVSREVAQVLETLLKKVSERNPLEENLAHRNPSIEWLGPRRAAGTSLFGL